LPQASARRATSANSKPSRATQAKLECCRAAHCKCLPIDGACRPRDNLSGSRSTCGVRGLFTNSGTNRHVKLWPRNSAHRVNRASHPTKANQSIPTRSSTKTHMSRCRDMPSVIDQIDGPIITLRDGRNQVNFRRPVAKQQLFPPSWVNARFRA
jgi:hypothetical protein